MAFSEKIPSALEYTFDGNGLAILGTPAGKLVTPAGYSGLIQNAGIVADLAPANLVIEILACQRNVYPAGLLSITNGIGLSLAAQTTMLDDVLKDWIREVAPDQVFEFRVLLTDTATNILVFLSILKF